MLRLQKIISGGQTGADRGALDAAAELGLQRGGYCPAGRRAEDGRIPRRYRELTEIGSADYRVRTEWNVHEADATLIVTREGARSRGTELTASIVDRLKRPGHVFFYGPRWGRAGHRVRDLERWLRDKDPAVLNVAGPRESRAPGIQRATRELLVLVIGSQVCPGCEQEIDLSTCGCGAGRVGHGTPMDAGHPFVPLGCNCLRVAG